MDSNLQQLLPSCLWSGCLSEQMDIESSIWDWVIVGIYLGMDLGGELWKCLLWKSYRVFKDYGLFYLRLKNKNVERNVNDESLVCDVSEESKDSIRAIHMILIWIKNLVIQAEASAVVRDKNHWHQTFVLPGHLVLIRWSWRTSWD